MIFEFWILNLRLTPDPSPARSMNKPVLLLAGEGRVRERGRSPLSKLFPLSKRLILYVMDMDV
jgi:hypothetical protein